MGYDPTYGARPLKRVIQKRLVDPLALGLLKGDYAAGDHIRVDAEPGDPPALAFTRTRGAGGAPPAEEEAPAGVA
jgi:ATP-dependent Clp protease ATP-binding subunit ClpB